MREFSYLNLNDEENRRVVFSESKTILEGFEKRNVPASHALAILMVVISAIQEISDIDAEEIQTIFAGVDSCRRKLKASRTERS